MDQLRPALVLAAALLTAPAMTAFGQGNCENFSAFGTATADGGGALTTISTCSFESEYSTITGVIAAATYQFTSSSGSYITVRQDTPGGTVIGQGYSPVTVVAVTAGNLYPHWTLDDACNTATNCVVTTVQLFLNCTPPTASYSVIDDCMTNSFTVEVNITSLGDGAFVDLQYNVNGGPFTILAGLGIGLQTLGPFVVGDVITIVVAHESDPACNISFFNVVSTGVCPVILTCGGAELNETYCYGPNDSQSWWYQTTGIEPIAILFSTGMIESATFDHLTIYDGPNNTSPILYDHVGGTEDLAGLLQVSTGPDLFMEMSSDGSVQCSTNTSWTWNWTVGCLDCLIPEAQFTLIPDCIHREFSVLVDVTSTGDAQTVDLISTASQDTLFGVGVGQHNFGPFGVDTATTVGVYNGDNNLCRFFSPDQVYLSDSCVIDASCEFLNTTYCYENSDDAWFVFQSVDSMPITLNFLAGELLVGDKVVIYNGLNDLAAVIFNGSFGGNLTGLVMSSSNPDNALTVNVISNTSGSCQDGGTTEAIQWVAGCGLVSVTEVDASSFIMYPNPTTGILRVEMGEETGPVQLSLLDVSGRIVIEEGRSAMNAEGFTMDLNALQSGNYFLRISTQNWVKTKQVQLVK